MHGAGNDYIYVDTTRYPIENPEKLSKKWSAPHTGIGSDGLVLIGRSDKADFSMRIFNADGSEAKMCGNASRCIGKYLYDYKLTSKTEITLDTLSGIKILKLHATGDKVDTVTVDMGIPSDEPVNYDGKGSKPMTEHPIEIDGIRYTGTTVSMGNPHLVIFAFLTGRAGRKSIIVMDGGTLTIEWDIATKHVFMTGEATKVFEGEMETDEEL